MWAADAGNVEAVDALISAGANFNTATPAGFTAMMFASRDGNLKVAKRLIDAGVDVNAAIAPDSKREAARGARAGTSALIFTVESAHYELAMLLVGAGADPNDQRSGFAPLHVISWVRKPNSGDNPDGDPPPRGSGSLSDLQFVREIVAAGADVNVKLTSARGGKKASLNTQGTTPMLYAAKTADVPLMKVLVDLGADPLAPNTDGCTPLMAAAGVGVRSVDEEAGTEPEVLEAIDYLVSLGADVNTVDKNKETAMHGAAYRNFPLAVARLAKHGADPKVWDHKNKSGWTPFLIAQGNRPGSFKPSPVTEAALQAAAVVAAPRRPNILIMYTDDQAQKCLGIMGNKHIQTPNMDRLAKRGVLFNNAFVTTAICCCNRACLLTGQHMVRHGIRDFATPLSAAAFDQTYPALLRQSGYRTGFLGKYAIGNPGKSGRELSLPADKFDFWYGFDQGINFRQEVDGKPRYLTELMTDKAIEFLQTNKSDQPFCLSIAFKEPHGPFNYFDPNSPNTYADVEIPTSPSFTVEDFESQPEFIRKGLNATGSRKRLESSSDNGGMLNVSGQQAWELGHRQMGLEFLANTCEAAWHQGIDLYSEENNKLLLGFEYTAKYNLGYDVPYEPFRSYQGRYHYESISKSARGKIRSMYEKVLNYYQNRKGLEAPFTAMAIEKSNAESRGTTLPWGTLMNNQRK